jgi:hypothetical protein
MCEFDGGLVSSVVAESIARRSGPAGPRRTGDYIGAEAAGSDAATVALSPTS